MTDEQVINYHAARSILEQAGVEFGARDAHETREHETHVKKSRASKSQLRREARNG